MRRALLALTASATILLAPTAQAQTHNDALDGVNTAISTMDCSALKFGLNLLGVTKEDTKTRGDLVKNLNAISGDNLTIRLLGKATADATADRAVECGIVQADPEILGISSAKIEEIFDFTRLLSSQAQV